MAHSERFELPTLGIEILNSPRRFRRAFNRLPRHQTLVQGRVSWRICGRTVAGSLSVTAYLMASFRQSCISTKAGKSNTAAVARPPKLCLCVELVDALPPRRRLPPAFRARRRVTMMLSEVQECSIVLGVFQIEPVCS